MDRIASLKAFCRIVERGSFARAAEDLGVSATLLSREVKDLEAALGVTLLARTTRAMAVTDHGRRYYHDALDILAAMDRMEARARSGAGRVAGDLRINAPASFGQVVLVPGLSDFLSAHPNLNVTLALDDRVVDMIEGGFDLSIRVRRSLPDSILFAKRIAGVTQGLFAAPRYLERAGTPRRPADLAGHRTLAFALADHARVWDLTGPGGETRVEITPRLTVGSSPALRDLMIAGEGIGSLPDFLSAPAVAAGDLVPVLPDHALPERHVFAVTHARAGADAKVAAFIDYLRHRLGGAFGTRRKD